MPEYYFAIASKNFLMNQEPIEEILRERTSYYKNIKKEVDFWFITNPNLLQSFNMKNIKKHLNEDCAAIISSDIKFIQWLKLRIGFVAIGKFQSNHLFSQNINYQ
uniref:Ycf54 n=1 Tax=Gracilaria vermiculophylla TaxID=2608709 RepID=A0A345U8Q9_9FLOR|nr:hypothetical protein [Gracilaria vermiculophylla]AXI96845.1 hypothetical protein [Gracilaria vermiculophylla]QXU75059.1 hypothetical protein [Gracilaria vermiculophylla]WDZ68019.1 hypothetical protein [Gracilaria vermiculophylla]